MTYWNDDEIKQEERDRKEKRDNFWYAFTNILIWVVLILFVWFLVVSFLSNFNTECPKDIQLKGYLMNYGEERISTTESCFAGCKQLVTETGYQLNCDLHCSK